MISSLNRIASMRLHDITMSEGDFTCFSSESFSELKSISINGSLFFSLLSPPKSGSKELPVTASLARAIIRAKIWSGVSYSLSDISSFCFTRGKLNLLTFYKIDLCPFYLLLCQVLKQGKDWPSTLLVKVKDAP